MRAGPSRLYQRHFAMIEFLLAVPTILRRYSMQIEPGHENTGDLPLSANPIQGGVPVRLHSRAPGEMTLAAPTLGTSDTSWTSDIGQYATL
jgi:hypothetical protein